MKYESIGITIGVLYCIWKEKRKSALSPVKYADMLTFLSSIQKGEEKQGDWEWKVKRTDSYIKTTIRYRKDTIYQGLHTTKEKGGFQVAYRQCEETEESLLHLETVIHNTLKRLINQQNALLLAEEQVKKRLKTHLRILKQRR